MGLKMQHMTQQEKLNNLEAQLRLTTERMDRIELCLKVVFPDYAKFMSEMVKIETLDPYSLEMAEFKGHCHHTREYR